MAAWAKTNRKPPSNPCYRWLSVRGHALDAAAAAGSVLDGRTLRSLEAAAGRHLHAVDIDRIKVLVGLHDIGKVLLGFRGKQDRAAPWDAASECHVRPLIHLLGEGRSGNLSTEQERFAEAAGLIEVADWFATVDDALNVLEGVFSHHGGPRVGRPSLPVPFDRQISSHEGTDAISEASAVVEALKAAFPTAFAVGGPPLPSNPGFLHLLIGLVMQADWMASTLPLEGQPGFSLDGDGFGTSGRLRESTVIASGILAGCGFHDGLASRTPLDPVLVVPGGKLRPVQEQVRTIPLSSHIVGIEAPTGEGKTEAAVLRFLALHEVGLVDGMYFAVPTRSAGVSLHLRIGELVKKHFPEAPPVVLAVPGALPMRAQDKKDDGIDAGQRPWSSERGRFMASGVAVGTVDQALLSGLRVHGAHQRAFAMSRTLLVVDEVHACDAHMVTVLGNVVRRHISTGGHVVILSATFGASGLSALGYRTVGLDEARSRPYPCIWHGDSPANLEWTSFEADSTRRRRITFRKLDEASAVASVAKAVAAGARVLVILSTVRDAIRFQEALERSNVPTMALASSDGEAAGVMHHGRYAVSDRAMLDNEIRRLLCPALDRPSMGVACVGTQTVEQSLDIDADLLVTDLCPADILIQRLGRLHRANGSRPAGCELPVAIILDPGDLDGFVDQRGRIVARGGPTAVYGNLAMLQATLDVLDGGEVALPCQCREIVERVTHPESLASVAASRGEKWLLHYKSVSSVDEGLSALAERSSIRWDLSPLEGRNRIGSVEEDDVRTRIGADSVEIDAGFTSFLGNRVETLSLPLRVLRGNDPRQARILSSDGKATILQVGTVLLRYDRYGLNPM